WDKFLRQLEHDLDMEEFEAYLDKQEDDRMVVLVFGIEKEVLDSVQKGLLAGMFGLTLAPWIKQAAEKIFNSYLSQAGKIIISKAFNDGRRDEAGQMGQPPGGVPGVQPGAGEPGVPGGVPGAPEPGQGEPTVPGAPELAAIAAQWSAILDDKMCFVKGTEITTRAGSRNIEDVKIGEYVLTRNGYKKVKYTSERIYRGNIVTVCFGGRSITCTEDHPFFVRGKGWVEAKRLLVGDQLINARFYKFFSSILEIYYKLRNSNEMDSVFHKIFILPFVSIFIRMPICAIGLDSNFVFGNVKINRIPTNVAFLNKFNIQFAENVLHFNFKSGFSAIFPIAGNAAKSSYRGFTGCFSETNPTVQTSNKNGWPVTIFRTVFTRISGSVEKLFSTTKAICINYWRHSAFPTAKGIATRIRPWNLKFFIATGTYLRNVFVLISTSNVAICLRGSVFGFLGRIYQFATSLTWDVFALLGGKMIASSRAILGLMGITRTASSAYKFLATTFASCFVNCSHRVNYIKSNQERQGINVYNLAVEDKHEYFANGVLVHNCPYCSLLDGQVIYLTNPDYERYIPGQIHQDILGWDPRSVCRCIWVYIFKMPDEDLPEETWTGLPDYEMTDHGQEINEFEEVEDEQLFKIPGREDGGRSTSWEGGDPGGTSGIQDGGDQAPGRDGTPDRRHAERSNQPCHT
ncbi:MAG: hypothetical protein NTY37_05440, partial [Methanothrix sp.]|nr:hypothetical protein [Methanothrix sp.]